MPFGKCMVVYPWCLSWKRRTCPMLIGRFTLGEHQIIPCNYSLLLRWDKFTTQSLNEGQCFDLCPPKHSTIPCECLSQPLHLEYWSWDLLLIWWNAWTRPCAVTCVQQPFSHVKNKSPASLPQPTGNHGLVWVLFVKQAFQRAKWGKRCVEFGNSLKGTGRICF